MGDASWLMAHASRLVAQGSWPRKIWHWVSQARALAPNCSWPRGMSLEPRALRHEPWTLGHEPLTVNTRLFDEIFNSKFQNFQYHDRIWGVPNFKFSEVSNCQGFNSFKIKESQRFKTAKPNFKNLRTHEFRNLRCLIRTSRRIKFVSNDFDSRF